ncbi:hypothetical protein B0H17DRAFT_1137322 [Mycena rosella]|uniref:Uncharacterized protein n=1 Tax=Mycena rosella TaxID=1033263 RepID=A0AAD7D992_MYCRO|nr:hypothetical protein B0H17DRAFT_1137322 [Mycena rosella]
MISFSDTGADGVVVYHIFPLQSTGLLQIYSTNRRSTTKRHSEQLFMTQPDGVGLSILLRIGKSSFKLGWLNAMRLNTPHYYTMSQRPDGVLPIIPRLSGPRLSEEQLFTQRLAEADATTQEAMTVSLEGTYQFKKLVRPTLEGHERTKKLWALFVKNHREKDTLPAIVIGAQLPSWDITKEFVRWLGIALKGRLERYVVKSTVEGGSPIAFA